MAWSRSGRLQEAKPFESSLKVIRARRAWRLAHSWPFSHTLAG
jgi:hypothetical protein